MTPSDLPVEALAKKLEQEGNYACKDGNRCVCGGDTQGVREGCAGFDVCRATDFWQAASLLRSLAAERDALRAALQSAIKVADEARDEWDAAPNGMKAGKLLIALSGFAPGYRADIDAIHTLSTDQHPRPTAGLTTNHAAKVDGSAGDLK